VFFNYSLTHLLFPSTVVFLPAMCAFSLTYPFLHVWSVNLQTPMRCLNACAGFW